MAKSEPLRVTLIVFRVTWDEESRRRWDDDACDFCGGALIADSQVEIFMGRGSRGKSLAFLCSEKCRELTIAEYKEGIAS